MKALFSFGAIVFLIWVGFVYVLPQTGYVERLHRSIELRLSRQLDSYVEIDKVRFGFFELVAENITAYRKGTKVLQIPQATAKLNLSALISKRIHWFELSLTKPRLVLVHSLWQDEGKNLFAEIKLLRSILEFNFIRINDGVIKQHDKSWQAINGFISAGRSQPMSAELNFNLDGMAYRTNLSLARLDGNKPVAMQFTGSTSDRKLMLDGVWQGDNFYGDLELQNKTFALKSRIDSVLSHKLPFQSQLSDATLTFPNWVLSGSGSAQVSKDKVSLYLNMTKGSGVYKKIKLTQIKGKLFTDFSNSTIKELSARIKNNQGKITGSAEITNNRLEATLNISANQLSTLLPEYKNALPSKLGAVRLNTLLVIEQDKIKKLQAKGSIGSSAVWVRLKGDTLFSKWTNDRAVSLARQWKMPSFFASKGKAKLVWQLQLGQPSRADSLFALRAKLGKNSYRAKGSLNLQEGSFKGNLDMNANFARGKADLVLNSKSVKAALDLETLALDRLDLDLTRAYRGAFDVRANKASYGKNLIRDFYVQLYFNEDNLRVKSIKGAIAEGRFEAAADLTYENNKPHYALALKLSNIKSEKITKLLFDKKFLEGNMNLTTRLSFSGETKAQMLRSLNGKGNISVREGKFIGFDANLLNQSLPQLEIFSLLTIVIDYAFNHGKTAFGDGRSQFYIQNGKLRTTPLQFEGENIFANLNFSADLVRQKLQAKFKFKLPLKVEYPALGWTIKGNWSNLTQSFDSIGLERAFAKDVITGGINKIKTSNVQRLPLALQDLLREARSSSGGLDTSQLQREMDLTISP